MTHRYKDTLAKCRIKEKSILAYIAMQILGTSKVAMVIGKTIYLYGISKELFLKDEVWVLHEICHILQFQKYGFWRFLYLYIRESIRKGYYNNRFEKQARRFTGQET